ncbi:transposase, partial [Salmonella enterica subsp. enterica serovar Rissen]|nr:transposase [Salmonella enterica subsp. enterica serovar Rissen]
MGSCAAPSAKGDDKFITTDYLQQCLQYLVLDATYESVRVGSHVVKQALLVAIGVDYSGNRHILDAEV